MYIEKISLSRSTPIFSDTKIQNSVLRYLCFRIPYHHPSLCRLPVFAVTFLSVVWCSGTTTVTSRTKGIKIGNVTVNIHTFFTSTKIQQNLDEKKVYNKHIITVVT